MRKIIITSITTFFIFFNSCSSDSDPQEIPDTTAPIIKLFIVGVPDTHDGETIVVSNQIEVIVDAKDEGGISKIEAFINDEKVGEDTMAPYKIIIDLTSYASKSGKSFHYKNYTLKITATDLNGNSTSTQQQLNIDNEMPAITEVSLEEGTVLNGDTNEVVFQVADNEELSSVRVYLNEELLSDITDETYEININTNALIHGENVLKIEAKDLAENIGSHIVNFIVDNNGPNIILESILDGQIIDETISLAPQVYDEYSEVSSLEIFYNEESLVLFDDSTSIYQFDFDTDLYEVGEGTFILEAKDTLGNSNQVSINVNILRLLLKITVDEGYFSPNIYSNHFVFASEADGSLIDLEELIFETREIKLHALGEFDNDKDFTLTFASLGRPGTRSALYSILNLKRSEPEQLDLHVPKRFRGVGSTYYPINGFDASTKLYCHGRDYYFSSNQTGDPIITDFEPSNHAEPSNGLYIYGFNRLNNFYNYQFVDRPIPSDFEMNFANFSTQNIETRQYATIPSDFLVNNSNWLVIYGFQDQADLDSDIFHTLFGYGSHSISSYNYPLNTQFYSYAHEVTIGNYHSRGLGLPPEIIEIPDWTIDYTFQNNRVTLAKSGSGYTNGEIYLTGGYDVSSPYEWNLVFNGIENDEIVLPNIPSELQNFNFYSQYQNTQLEINRVGLLKYKNIDDYSDYLENIVKQNKVFGKSAPVFETIISVENGYQNFSNNGYFFNWW